MIKLMKFFQRRTLICLAAIFFSGSSAVCAFRAQSPVSPTTVPVVLRGHHSGVTAVQFSPDGAWLASSSLDGTVRLWSTRTWKTALILNHGSEVYAIAFSQDGRLLASGGYDHRLLIWEARSGRLVRAVKLPDWVVGITFTPTGQLISGCSDGLVRLLDSSTGVIKRTIDTKHEMVSFAVSSDGRYLATALPIMLWDLASGQRLSKDIQGFGQNGLAFMPTGALLASAEGTGGARIYSVPAGELRGVLRIEAQKQVLGPSGFGPVSVNMPASAVGFSHNGAWLAIGGTDFGVKLWQVVSDSVDKTPTRELLGHSMTVTGVSFSPDDSRLASGSLDRTIRLWKLR